MVKRCGLVETASLVVSSLGGLEEEIHSSDTPSVKDLFSRVYTRENLTCEAHILEMIQACDTSSEPSSDPSLEETKK